MNKIKLVSFLNEEEKAEANKRKVHAIKMYRDRTGADLITAKEEVERYLFNPKLYFKQCRDSQEGSVFNQSKYDAYSRISKARDMSFSGATEEYLVALAKHLKSWHTATILELRRLRKEKVVVNGDETLSSGPNLLQHALNQKRRYTHRDLQNLARCVEKYIRERYSHSVIKLLNLGKWECVMRESEIVFVLPYKVKNPDGSNETLEYKITL
jgi:hypothetical protein